MGSKFSMTTEVMIGFPRIKRIFQPESLKNKQELQKAEGC